MIREKSLREVIDVIEERYARRGLGLGPCGMGLARGRGWGRNWNLRNYRNYGRNLDAASRLRYLEEEERLLRERLDAVRREIEELRK